MATHAPMKRPFCASCSKPARLCLCSRIKHLSFDNAIALTILQHSEEKNHPLNSTRILSLGLKNIAVVPVSDVHFEARLDFRLIGSERRGTSTAAFTNGGCANGGRCLENSEFRAITDSVETEKELGESGMGVVCESNDGSRRDRMRSPNYSAISDMVKTHEAVRETCSEAKIFARSLESVNFLHGLEESDSKVPKAAGECGSRTATFATELENVGYFYSDLHISELHEQKKADSGSSVSQTVKENTHLQKNQKQYQKQLEKSNRAKVLQRSIEMDTFQGSDSTNNGMAESSENGSLEFSTDVLRKNFSDSHDVDFVSTSKMHENDLKKSKFGTVSGSTTAKEMPLESQLTNSHLDQSEAGLTSEEATIIATIAQRGFTCSIASLRVSRNGEEKSDFGFFSSSLISKAAIANGFIVKKVQRKPSDCNSSAVREIDEFEITVPSGSALLFPSEKSVGLESVDFEVKHLIVLDGTWSKAKRMYYENPWLKLLPHLKLDPSERSLYNEVRHQPKAGCLSTIESIVCVLKALGENSEVLDDLLNVFESMVGDQRRCKEERLSRKSSLT